MPSVKDLLAALEQYKRSCAPSGVGFVLLSDGWAAEYGGERRNFTTQEQAVRFIHQNAPKNTPILIIDV